MDNLRTKYRVPYRVFDADVGRNCDQRKNDGLNAPPGAVNAILVGLAFWSALGPAMYRGSWGWQHFPASFT